MENVEREKQGGFVVYILAHDKPEYTVLAVRSVLEQEVAGGFRLVVSDNSDGGAVHQTLV